MFVLDDGDDGVMWPGSGGLSSSSGLGPKSSFSTTKKVDALSLSLPPALLPSESVVSFDH